jgi:glycosyltransferase involved in cell wall biosynthesis
MEQEMKFEYFILTLNEEKNIKECIESIQAIGGLHITVLDGGSTDNTNKISDKFDVNFLSFPGSSLSFRRGYAIDESKAEYVVFVDADQRLIKYEYNLEEAIDKYFIDDEKLSGLVFSKITPKNSNYWERGFGLRHKIVAGGGKPQKVIGTPTVFKSKYGKEVGFNRDLEGSCDDTVFCDRLIKSGYTLRSMPQNAIEIVRSSFKDTIKKAFWYGTGDSEYIKLYRDTRYRHLFHVIVRMPIIHPFIVLFMNPPLVIFFTIFGITRLYGMIYGFFVKKDLSSTRA